MKSLRLPLEPTVAGWLARHALPLQRGGLGIVFLWFGLLKFVPGASPAEGLIRETVAWVVDPRMFLPVLAAWESVIGICLLAGVAPRATLLLLFAHMVGTFMPLVACPDRVWTDFPVGLTLEGQYILKNLVLVGAGLVLFGRLATPFEARRFSSPCSGSRGLDRLRARRAARLDAPAGDWGIHHVRGGHA